MEMKRNGMIQISDDEDTPAGEYNVNERETKMFDIVGKPETMMVSVSVKSRRHSQEMKKSAKKLTNADLGMSPAIQGSAVISQGVDLEMKKSDDDNENRKPLSVKTPSFSEDELEFQDKNNGTLMSGTMAYPIGEESTLSNGKRE